AAASPVRLAPEWRGGSPPAAEVRVVRRRGVDRQPLDPRSAITRERLQAYVWAEQRGRLARLGAALELAAADPAPVDEADAADWLEAQLSPEPEPGVCRVVMHTIAFQYFPPEGQARIAARIAAAGARAGGSPGWPVRRGRGRSGGRSLSCAQGRAAGSRGCSPRASPTAPGWTGAAEPRAARASARTHRRSCRVKNTVWTSGSTRPTAMATRQSRVRA